MDEQTPTPPPPPPAPEPSPKPPPRRWRGETGGPPPRSWTRLWPALLLMGVLGGGVLLLLTWVRPVTPPSLVAVVLSGPDAPLPQAEGDRKALLANPMVTPVEPVGPGSAAGSRVSEALKGHTADDVVILSLTAKARVETGQDGGRSVVILPADAGDDRRVPGEPLDELRKALYEGGGSPHVVLLLDLHPAATDPRSGWGDVDLAGRVVESFADDQSPRTLVLTSCAPGQESLSSEVLGRSVFQYYVGQGLNGWADVAPTDGRVTARELAAFVRERVARWAQRNRGTSQTPLTLVEPSDDFVLVSLPRGRPIGPPVLPDPKAVPAYPEWLAAGWRARDDGRAKGLDRGAPRAFARFEASLLGAERDWCRGGDPARVREAVGAAVARWDKARSSAGTVDFPRPVSLALEAATGHTPDPAAGQALRALLTKREAAPPAEKPGDAEAADARLIAEFYAGLKAATPLDLAAAVVQAAGATREPTPDLIGFLDRLLAVSQPQPLYAETLALREAAGLPRGGWSSSAVRLALEVARRGELASARPEAGATLAPLTDAAERTRYEAEVLWRARGYAPAAAAEARLREAGVAIDAALSAADGLEVARRAVDDALALLPAVAPALSLYPDLEPHWFRSVAAAGALAEALDLPATQPDGFLGEKAAALRQAALALRADLGRLRDPFQPPAVARLIGPSVEPTPATARALANLLSTPFPAAADRAAIWKAYHALALRLAEATIRLDARDGRTLESSPTPSRSEWAEMIRQDRSRAARAAQVSLGLLALGSVDQATLAPRAAAFKSAAEGATDLDVKPRDPSEPASPPSVSLPEWLDGVWTKLTSDPARPEAPAAASPERLERVLMPSAEVAGFDNPERSPTRLARQKRFDALRARLAVRYAYRAHDLDGSPFYAAAAQEYLGGSPAEEPVFLTIQAETAPPRLDPRHPDATTRLRFERTGAAGGGEVGVDILNGDPAWQTIGLASISSAGNVTRQAGEAGPSAFSLRVEGVEPVEVALTVRMKPEPQGPAAPALPLGFLLRVRTPEWTYHRTLPVALEPPSRQFRAFLSTDPARPLPVAEVRVRPVGDPAPYYLFVRNPSDRERKVRVGLLGRGGVVRGGEVDVTVAPGQTRPVVFGPPSAKPEADRVAFLGPLAVRVSDADDPSKVLTEETLPVDVAPASDFVRVVGARFDPPGAGDNSRSKLSVTLRAVAPIVGPPCLVEMVLPAGRIPGLLSEGEGTFRAELAENGAEAALFAQGLRFDEREEEAGLVYLTIDGVPRAMVLRATFARRGEPTQPRPESRPALRLATADTARADAPLQAALELDRPPDGATIELTLGGYAGGEFRVDARATADATRNVLHINPHGPAGAIAFEAAVRDPVLTLPSTRVRGRRELRARLVDSSRREVASDLRVITFDDRAPGRVKLIDLPKYAKPGSPLVLRATGSVPSSGLKEVVFFVGRPAEGKRPPDALAVPARAVDQGRTTWQARINLPPDRRGPTQISVQFSSGVALDAFDTATVDLVDAVPVEPGSIKGRVVEGPRPQAGLDVVLLDGKGMPLARATSTRTGDFEFPDVPPGSYEVVGLKATPPTRGVAKVEVKPGATVEATVEMSRVR